ncbi:hypothetical protein ACROYT_G013890 [Oculina patagonica]
MLGHSILIRTLLPTTNRLLRPQVVDGVAEKNQGAASESKNVPKISAQEGTANGSVQELSKLKELFPTEDEVDFDTVLKCSFNLEHAIDTLVNRSVDH